MKKFMTVTLCLCAAFLLGGCIQMSMNVKVNKNGSGMIVQRLMMDKQLMTEVGDGGEVCQEQEFRENASKMGEGVKFKSAREVSNDKFLGCETTYTFKDITRLALDQNPSGNMPQEDSGEPERHEYLNFTLDKKDGVTTLGIALPEEDRTETPKEPETAEEQQQKALMKEMMRQMLTDMYVGVTVEVDGQVVKSDATYMDGPVATLVEMDFNKLLNTPGAFDRLMDSDSRSIEETKRIMKNTPGIRGEEKRQISISFK